MTSGGRRPFGGGLDLVEQHPIVEQMLEERGPDLGAARVAYAGHVYRVLNYARALLGSDQHNQELALAAAFHDIGIWSDGTFDYLLPSGRRAEAFRQARAPELRTELIAELIGGHHALLPPRTGVDLALRDAFRRADLIDVSAGWIRAGLPRRSVREVEARLPYQGFHGVLVRTAVSWAVRHPLRPLPMVRLR